jgi:4-alpha-glucanotransferase
MKIDFYLRFHTKYGEKVFITGNTFSLGQSDEKMAMPLQFLNKDFWHVSIEISETDQQVLHYQYIYKNDKDEYIKEAEKQRTITLKEFNEDNVTLIDTWNSSGETANVFYTAPFKKVFLKQADTPKRSTPKSYTHQFKIKAPLLKENECICLSGSANELHNWSTKKPALLEKEDDWWSVKLDLSKELFPLYYKYGIYNYKKSEFVSYESGDNRIIASGMPNSITVLHDGFVNIPYNAWKGAGIAIPVFSLRSANSFGVGEFTDIKLLVDWASKTGLKLIQLLPVNDTSASFSMQDSYPYAAISAYALHPIYINLKQVAGKKYSDTIKSIAKKQKQLNTLPELAYEKVIQFKMQLLREIYDLDETGFIHESDYKFFFDDNKQWLKPYAAFCYLRDKNVTPDFNQWKTHSVYIESEIDKLVTSKSASKKEIRFYYFIQYHLHLQLEEAVKYAHKKNVALKGDVPIGIYRHSADAWTAPQLFNLCWQAGAPPDDFAVKGQNWGFPTYNWQRMQDDSFNWWRQRFNQMSNYFDAFRIDHILGFFRIWSIPMNGVEGILGRFVPAIPISINEFGERGIWFDYDRYCKPFITDEILKEIFGANIEFVKSSFLQKNEEGQYGFLDEFNTQRKVESFFAVLDVTDENNHLKNGLFDLLSNVLFYEQPDSEEAAFHFRISIDKTSSFKHLDESTKGKLQNLYIDYFFKRQDDFWKVEALRKLPYLKESTDMLICGEDLGMVPHCVPQVMKDLGILGLEIQRMPKNPHTEFFHPKDAPYLSVITPSTHDMSTLRGWWEEDRQATEKFYNIILEGPGDAPVFCEPWVNRAIVLQHLYSPAMWSIFQLQDLLGMSEKLRRENPHEERINVPADPNHYWQYRMHINLEQLIKEKEFNEEVKDYITNSGRG